MKTVFLILYAPLGRTKMGVTENVSPEKNYSAGRILVFQSRIIRLLTLIGLLIFLMEISVSATLKFMPNPKTASKWKEWIIQSGTKGLFVLDDNDTLLCTLFVVRSEKKKWVAWLPMIPFTLDDKIMSPSSANGLVCMISSKSKPNICTVLGKCAKVDFPSQSECNVGTTKTCLTRMIVMNIQYFHGYTEVLPELVTH